MWVRRVYVQANIGPGHLKNTSQRHHCLEQLVRLFPCRPLRVWGTGVLSRTYIKLMVVEKEEPCISADWKVPTKPSEEPVATTHKLK